MGNADYQDGRKDGLREALAVLADEEAKWAEKMARRKGGRTLQAQAIRKQAYKTAQVRVQTLLNKIEREGTARSTPVPIEHTLDKLGL